jgi:hypothetical protein
MKILQDTDFSDLKLNDIVYIEESYNKIYKYVGNFIGVTKNEVGIGYWLQFSIIRCINYDLSFNELIFTRFSPWNNFYKPEKDNVINQYLQRYMNEIINKKTNKKLLLLDQWF